MMITEFMRAKIAVLCDQKMKVGLYLLFVMIAGINIMDKKVEIKKIIDEMHIFMAYPERRTPTMLAHYAAYLNNYPLVMIEQAKKRIKHTYSEWVTLDQSKSFKFTIGGWFEILEQIGNDENKRKATMTTEQVFDFNRLPREGKTNIAKFCCDLVRKRLREVITVKEMAEEMIKTELTYPNLGLAEQGASLLRYAEKTQK